MSDDEKSDFWSDEKRAEREAEFKKQSKARQERDEQVDNCLNEYMMRMAAKAQNNPEFEPTPAESRETIVITILLIEKSNRPNFGGIF